MSEQQQDIRWIQRFSNFKKAMDKFTDAVYLGNADELNELEREGLIQRFEYTHELAWKVMKDYLEYQGNTEITGSRDATREAFKVGIIEDGHTWLDMIASRNRTSHTYNESVAMEISEAIINEYHDLFLEFHKKMDELERKE